MNQITDKPLGGLPNPTPEELDSVAFEAIWGAIKSWDVNVPEFYEGYCGANGSHVVLILHALESVGAIASHSAPQRSGDRPGTVGELNPENE